MAYLSRDYYRMGEEELTQVIRDMRGWLLKFSGHEMWWKVMFALGVACTARELLKDPLPNEILDIFV